MEIPRRISEIGSGITALRNCLSVTPIIRGMRSSPAWSSWQLEQQSLELGIAGVFIMPRDCSKAYIPGTSDLTETYPTFDPFVYSLETLPFLKLDMGQYWMPNANRGAGLSPRLLILRLAYGRTASLHPRDSSVWLTWGCALRSYLWIRILIGGVLRHSG